jgi:hypothetical protein
VNGEASLRPLPLASSILIFESFAICYLLHSFGIFFIRMIQNSSLTIHFCCAIFGTFQGQNKAWMRNGPGPDRDFESGSVRCLYYQKHTRDPT